MQQPARSNHRRNRLGRFLSNPWVWLALAWAIGIVLGFAGLARYARLNGDSTRLLDLFYLLLQLITLESGAVQLPIPWELEVARFALPALAAWTFVRTAMAIFRDQAARLSLWFWRDHIIICGLGHKGYLLASDFLEAGQKVIVIEGDSQNDSIPSIRNMGGVVLLGDATDEQLLRQARIERADTLFAVLGDDALNAEVAVRAESILCELDRLPLRCIIHIVDPDLWDVLRAWEFAGDCLLSLRLDLFNIYQRGAELMLSEFPLLSVDAPNEAGQPAALVVGLGSLGHHLVAQIAEQWFRARRDTGKKIDMTVIDRDASSNLDLLKARFPCLGDVLSLRAFDLDVHSAAFLRGEYLLDNGSFEHLKRVYICMDNDPLVLSTALTIKRHLSGVDATIVMRTFEENGLIQMVRLTSSTSEDMPTISEFLFVERTCTRQLLDSGTHEKLARALHENYLRSQENIEGSKKSLPGWDSLSEAVKNANRSQADNIAQILTRSGFSMTLLRDWSEPAITFSDHEIEVLAKSEHERWCQERRALGWRHADGEKSEKDKTHPDLVSWDDLSESSREKNRATVRAIPRLLHEASFKIER